MIFYSYFDFLDKSSINTDLIRKLYNSSLTIRKRFTPQNRSNEEKLEEVGEDETGDNESSSEDEENDVKKSLLKGVDSIRQSPSSSPSPIQLILINDMSDSFSTLL